MTAPDRTPRAPRVVSVVVGGGTTRVVAVDGGAVTADLALGTADPDEILAAAAGLTPHAVVLVLGEQFSGLLADPAADGGVAVVRVQPRPAVDDRLARNAVAAVERLIGGRWTVRGGRDLVGRPLAELDLVGADRVAREIAGGGFPAAAVIGTGSAADGDDERRVADLLAQHLPGLRITSAADFGGQGLAARETTAVLNAALAVSTDSVLTAWERAAQRWTPTATLHVGRGDGGWSTVPWLRTLPVLALASERALAVLGAATLAGRRHCRVLLTDPARAGADPVVGEVRDGLVVVRTHAAVGRGDAGPDLVVATPVLTPRFREEPPAGPGPATTGRDGVAAPVVAGEDLALLAAVGAAVSRPTGFLDEIAVISSREQLEAVRDTVRTRVTAIATANGAAPGTAVVVEMSTVAVPFSPAGTVRLVARAAGTPAWAGATARSTDPVGTTDPTDRVDHTDAVGTVAAAAR